MSSVVSAWTRQGPAPVPVDETLPDYVLALQRGASYLPEDQQRLLRRAWSVGAAAHGSITLLAFGVASALG